MRLSNLPNMPALRASEIFQRPEVGLMVHGDLFIIVWAGEPTLAANKWLIERFVGMSLMKSPDLIGLQLIMPSAGMPNAETRRYIEEAFRTRLGVVRRMVTAPLGDSIRQSLIRTMLRGMSVISQRSQSMSVAGTIDDAISQTLALRTHQTPSRVDVLEDLRRIFAAMKINELLPLALRTPAALERGEGEGSAAQACLHQPSKIGGDDRRAQPCGYCTHLAMQAWRL